MEKSWENFWTTGKVEDYLTYRNCVTSEEKDEKKEQQAKTTKESDSGWKGFT